ncbi:codeine O-demethylase-like [Malania oleifera]|uniref:codeine O-demethylase-like n=1 Tax=Malania oleifera TaxID=397392 RepID=UPI0025AE66E8|nr:codeine O-demethylase-like [Malania oleifera]
MAMDTAALSKSVQEMSMYGTEPPPQYLVKESSFGSIGSSVPLGSIPIINVTLLAPSSSSTLSKEEEEELDKLRSALSSWGSFQAIEHGISNSFLDKVRGLAKHFLALPVEEKQKCSRRGGGAEGYGNDRIVSEKQVLDWCDRLSLRVFPENQRRLEFWPDNPNDFREVLNEYAIKTKSIMDLLFKAMARSLKLEESSFLDQFGDQPLMLGRFNFYPSCVRPDLVLGIKPHSDRSGITILLQDKEVEGLQFFKDDRWFRVPIIPYAILVNLGDQMQIMSNGIFKSPLHRVVTNSEHERISVAMFNEPDPEKEIGPANGLVDEKRPRLYRNVKNYAAINYECFQKGKIALDTVKV